MNPALMAAFQIAAVYACVLPQAYLIDQRKLAAKLGPRIHSAGAVVQDGDIDVLECIVDGELPVGVLRVGQVEDGVRQAVEHAGVVVPHALEAPLGQKGPCMHARTSAVLPARVLINLSALCSAECTDRTPVYFHNSLGAWLTLLIGLQSLLSLTRRTRIARVWQHSTLLAILMSRAFNSARLLRQSHPSIVSELYTLQLSAWHSVACHWRSAH